MVCKHFFFSFLIKKNYTPAVSAIAFLVNVPKDTVAKTNQICVSRENVKANCLAPAKLLLYVMVTIPQPTNTIPPCRLLSVLLRKLLNRFSGFLVV